MNEILEAAPRPLAESAILPELAAVPLVLAGAWLALAGLYLTALSLAATLPRRRRAVRPGGAPAAAHLAVVVPAHDEAEHIASTVGSLRTALASDPHAVLFVVADNCTDDTAARARLAGAHVLERRDPGRRGKAHALAHAFERLAGATFEAFVVVDADTIVTPRLLPAIRAELAAGADLVQVAYDLREPEATPRRGLLSLAFNAFNRLRPRGRDRVGLSCGLHGNGWAVRPRVLRALPIATECHVEDLEYHLRLVQAGFEVRFTDRATVFGDSPEGDRQAAAQRRRWESGRLQLALRWLPRLALAVLRGRWRALEPLLELLCPPLATLLLGTLAAALVPPLRPAALVAAGGLAVHALVLFSLTPAARWRALAYLPRYLCWKVRLLPRLLDLRASRRRWRAS